MKTAQRAWRCLARNPGKTLLLALVLFAASALYLGTTVILDAATQARKPLLQRRRRRSSAKRQTRRSPLQPQMLIVSQRVQASRV